MVAPNCGPYNYGNNNWGSYEWSAPNRLVWPEHLGNDIDNIGSYSGLDYMLLHNLYYLVYKDDFRSVVDLYKPITDENITIHGNKIFLSSLINNSYITLTAEDCAILEPGFEIEGSNFEVNFEPITINYDAKSFTELNPMLCP